MALDQLKPLSYRNLPISYRVLFDTEEVTEYLISVDGIEQQLDIDIVGEFEIDDVTLTMANRNHRFSGARSNIFLDLGYSQTGYNVPVTIRCGFDENGTLTDEVVFTGNILSVREGVKPNTVTVEVGDESRELYDEDIANFGVQKYGKIEEDTERTRDGIRGSYPLGPILSPVSEESVSGTSGTDALVYKEELNNEGVLDPLNFNYTDTEIRTEGGALDTDPVIAAKGPYRDKRAEDLVRRILDHYGITNRVIEVPFIPLTSDTFSTNGRVGYYTEGSAATNTDVIQWNGMVTDYLYDATNGRFLFLYCHRDPNILPQIIRYTVATDTWDILYTHTSHAEFWRIASADNDDLFILGTPGGTDTDWDNRYYDSSGQAGTSEVTIWKYNITADTFEVFVDNSDTHRPQLASFLQLGFEDDLDIGASPRVPDTNKGFQIVNNFLYYRYAHATEAGVAKIEITGTGTSAALFGFDFDRRFNWCSFDFTIDGGNSIGYGYANFVGTSESEFKIFSFMI